MRHPPSYLSKLVGGGGSWGGVEPRVGGGVLLEVRGGGGVPARGRGGGLGVLDHLGCTNE